MSSVGEAPSVQQERKRRVTWNHVRYRTFRRWREFLKALGLMPKSSSPEGEFGAVYAFLAGKTSLQSINANLATKYSHLSLHDRQAIDDFLDRGEGSLPKQTTPIKLIKALQSRRPFTAWIKTRHAEFSNDLACYMKYFVDRGCYSDAAFASYSEGVWQVLVPKESSNAVSFVMEEHTVPNMVCFVEVVNEQPTQLRIDVASFKDHHEGGGVLDTISYRNFAGDFLLYVSLPAPKPTRFEWNTGRDARAQQRLRGTGVTPPHSSMWQSLKSMRLPLDEHAPSVYVKVTPKTKPATSAPWDYVCPESGFLTARVTTCTNLATDLVLMVDGTPYGLPKLLKVALSADEDCTTELRLQAAGPEVHTPPFPEENPAHTCAMAWDAVELSVLIGYQPYESREPDITKYVSDTQFFMDVMNDNRTGPATPLTSVSLSSPEEYIRRKAQAKRAEIEEEQRLHKKPPKSRDAWKHLRDRLDEMKSKVPPELCRKIKAARSLYVNADRCDGDVECEAVKARFEEVRVSNDAACFRSAAPDGKDAVELIGPEVLRGFAGFYDISPAVPASSLTAGWSSFNEKYVTVSFEKATQYANLIGTSLGVESEWSGIATLDTAVLAEHGAFSPGNVYTAYLKNTRQQQKWDTINESIGRMRPHFYKVVKRLFPEIVMGRTMKNKDMVELLRSKIVMPGDGVRRPDLHTAAASICMFEEAVWLPVAGASPFTLQAAIKSIKFYHESFMPVVNKPGSLPGRLNGITEKTPYFLLQNGEITTSERLRYHFREYPAAVGVLRQKLIQQLRAIPTPPRVPRLLDIDDDRVPSIPSGARGLLKVDLYGKLSSSFGSYFGEVAFTRSSLYNPRKFYSEYNVMEGELTCCDVGTLGTQIILIVGNSTGLFVEKVLSAAGEKLSESAYEVKHTKRVAACAFVPRTSLPPLFVSVSADTNKNKVVAWDRDTKQGVALGGHKSGASLCRSITGMFCTASINEVRVWACDTSADPAPLAEYRLDTDGEKITCCSLMRTSPTAVCLFVSTTKGRIIAYDAMERASPLVEFQHANSVPWFETYLAGDKVALVTNNPERKRLDVFAFDPKDNTITINSACRNNSDHVPYRNFKLAQGAGGEVFAYASGFSNPVYTLPTKL